ncbi:hypothetical protein HMPREF3191_01606, partial [Veillonellaceae bacterium DNF00626]
TMCMRKSSLYAFISTDNSFGIVTFSVRGEGFRFCHSSIK